MKLFYLKKRFAFFLSVYLVSLTSHANHFQENGQSYTFENENGCTSTTSLLVENLVFDDFNHNPLSILLNNPDDEISFVQFDLLLPDKMQFVLQNGTVSYVPSERIPTNNKIIAAAYQADGNLRCVIASSKNVPILSNGGEIISFPLIANMGQYDGLAIISNIQMVTPAEKLITQSADYSNVSVNLSAGINDIEVDGGLNIRVSDNKLILSSSTDVGIEIYSISGVEITQVLIKAGIETEIALPNGIYIVNRKKIII